jgi:hypothetical protein
MERDRSVTDHEDCCHTDGDIYEQPAAGRGAAAAAAAGARDIAKGEGDAPDKNKRRLIRTEWVVRGLR